MENIKSFEIRWGDLDPNRHVANTAFSVLLNERRFSFLAENGFTQAAFNKLQIGPVILSEQFFYLKEVQPNSKVYIDIELLANTTDYKYIRFCHSLFNEQGKMAVYSTVLFTWMDLKTRKAIAPPTELMKITDTLKKSEHYQLMDEEEIRSDKIPVKSLDLSKVTLH
jgi:acyl-CoA thioester hydrolase